MAILQTLVEKWVALYVRLSRDDENEGDSNSIAHQQKILLLSIFFRNCTIGCQSLKNTGILCGFPMFQKIVRKSADRASQEIPYPSGSSPALYSDCAARITPAFPLGQVMPPCIHAA